MGWASAATKGAVRQRKRCIGLFPVYDALAVEMEKPKSVVTEFWGGLVGSACLFYALLGLFA
jgi:hypothetical protein